MTSVNPASTQLNQGDIILTGRKSQGVVSLAIKFGQRLRFGFKSPYTVWSHCAIVVDPEQFLVAEALHSGVKVNDMRKRYPKGDFAVIHAGQHVNERDMQQIMSFVQAVINSKTGYGVTTFIGLAIYCLTGSKLCIQSAGTAICSGLVCDAYTRAGIIWERPPYAMTPADIAAHYDFHYAD